MSTAQMSRIQELREKNDKELSDRRGELKREIFRLKSSYAPENKDKVHAQIRLHKKEIARIETILTEREIGETLDLISLATEG